jgi:hypothetical protein
MRFRAMVCALWYGVLPWWLYERRCHYPGMTYGQHLCLNLRYANAWATWRESASDYLFELEVNVSTEGES